MMVRIGVIGPTDSLKRIEYVAEEFDDAEFLPFVYEELTDINEIMKKNKDDVDQWFFSGVLNFTYAIENHLITQDKGSFPPLHGASFFGTLLEAQLNDNKVYQHVSIDTITDEEVDNILSYYKLESLNYYNSPFTGYKDIADFAGYHKKLYDEGKIEVVITAIKATYFALEKEGIPVYRVTPSYLSIKLTIQLLIERAQSDRYKNSQMAVIGCKVEFNLDKKDDLYYSFKMKHNELDLKRSLLLLSEKLNGSLMQLGDGLFFIFTSRGEVNKETEMDLFHVIEDIKVQSNIKVGIAVGFGETVSQAEQNVRYGFNSQGIDESTFLLIDEKQSITVKTAEKKAISYRTTESSEELSGVNPGVVSKIKSYAKQYNHNEFTSQDVSRWLQSSERNGRRILTTLDKTGVVEQCGKAQPGERGRPRKLYRFKK